MVVNSVSVLVMVRIIDKYELRDVILIGTEVAGCVFRSETLSLVRLLSSIIFFSSMYYGLTRPAPSKRLGHCESKSSIFLPGIAST
jgi:hypothetical protein